MESVLLYGSKTWTYPEYHQAFLGEKASLTPYEGLILRLTWTETKKLEKSVD